MRLNPMVNGNRQNLTPAQQLHLGIEQLALASLYVLYARPPAGAGLSPTAQDSAAMIDFLYYLQMDPAELLEVPPAELEKAANPATDLQREIQDSALSDSVQKKFERESPNARLQRESQRYVLRLSGNSFHHFRNTHNVQYTINDQDNDNEFVEIEFESTNERFVKAIMFDYGIWCKLLEPASLVQTFNKKLAELQEHYRPGMADRQHKPDNEP
ncbi:MAG: hypothetical protein KDK39_12085 [Leptospiraceae bacterium]|nr:hypothetical protein [Leptospiraceae bacterium]